MRFTPSQALDLVGITAETLRYWKKAMPPLAEKRGHAPCYTRAEIAGLIVIRMLVRDFRMDVSALATQSETLFRLCAAQWTLPNRRLLKVTCDGRVTAHEALAGEDFAEAAIVFPLDVAIQELESRLNEREGEAQMELGLPPVSVTTKARRAL
ncbi:MerR family transcriptional regulator [Variovorax paradoxus]|nr:MerR family transcriptional regulator [Variovorax paradoxus]